jgi:hypothetical protein
MNKNSLGEVALASALLGLGMSGFGQRHYFSRRHQPLKVSIEEVEHRWVRQKMYQLQRQRREIAQIIEGVAKAFGPWAHRFGFNVPHPQTREIARRLRQEAHRAAKQKG